MNWIIVIDYCSSNSNNNNNVGHVWLIFSCWKAKKKFIHSDQIGSYHNVHHHHHHYRQFIHLSIIIIIIMIMVIFIDQLSIVLVARMKQNGWTNMEKKKFSAIEITTRFYCWNKTKKNFFNIHFQAASIKKNIVFMAHIHDMQKKNKKIKISYRWNSRKKNSKAKTKKKSRNYINGTRTNFFSPSFTNSFLNLPKCIFHIS